jgi:hypothetical protein
MTLEPACADRNMSIAQSLPGNALYQYRLHRLLTGALASIIRTADLDCLGDNEFLNSSISFYDAQAQELSPIEINDSSEYANLSRSNAFVQ